jgi:hypothetical protein
VASSPSKEEKRLKKLLGNLIVNGMRLMVYHQTDMRTDAVAFTIVAVV